MKLLKIIGGLALVALLTALTQIGGLVFLLSLLTYRTIDNRLSNAIARIGLRFVSFLLLYLICVFLIVPLAAKPFGRVPLPLFRKNNVQPGTKLTCLLLRNYVKPELRKAVFEVAAKMNKEYPGTVLNYLDANFPFIDEFPLPPHISHNDGEKLDLSFTYTDKKTGSITNEIPTWIGYGFCEGPRPEEQNRPLQCARRGYWVYNFVSGMVPQESRFQFDARRTKRLVNLFAEHPRIGTMFIEPHLKTRLKLTSKKIRLHACYSVRHDDHVHVQLK